MQSSFYLKDVINTDILQKIQDEFAIASDFAVITVDYKGKPITKHSNCSKFCTLIRKNPLFKDLCEQSDAHGGLEAARNGNPYIYRCHLGLVDFAAPIIFKDQYLGSMLAGQVLIEEEKLNKLNNIMKNSIYPKENKELLDAYLSLPVIPLEKVKAASETLFLFCNYVVEKAIINIIQEELYNKDMQLIKTKQEQIELENMLKETELRALQAQINPHFLFNALNTIGRLSFIEKASKTQEVVYMLANMLRYSLKQHSKMIKLEDEVSYIQNYLKFQEIRFGDRIKFEINIPEEIKEIKIPFMILQPIIENSVLHGLEPKEEGGYIKVFGYVVDKDIIIDICDNGIGIPCDILRLIQDNNQDSSSLGINNVNRRMIHYFGTEYAVNIQSEINTGTTVKIKIPMK